MLRQPWLSMHLPSTNRPQRDLAGMATVIDVDGDSSYEITTSDSRFVVIDGQLLLGTSGALDYETESSIELEITATDLDNRLL